KAPPSCTLCHRCNTLFGICIYIWLGGAIGLLLLIAVLLILLLRGDLTKAPNPNKKKFKLKLPKINLPHIALPNINLPKIGKKDEMKIIKTKVKRSNQAASRLKFGRKGNHAPIHTNPAAATRGNADRNFSGEHPRTSGSIDPKAAVDLTYTAGNIKETSFTDSE
ncbi:MAG: hypothetical protein RSA20_00420, partial [Oscillospiraceae bacterium]